MYIDYTEVPFYFDMISEVHLHPTESSSLVVSGYIKGEIKHMPIGVKGIEHLARVKEELKSFIGILSVRPSDTHHRTLN